MNRRLYASMLTAACAVLPLAFTAGSPAAAQSVMRPSSDIVLSIGRGQLVTVPGNLSDVFIANDAIADVQVKSQRQIYVFGKSGGETTLYASDAGGNVIWAANIRVGSNIDSIDQMLALAMPEAKIGVSTMGTNTVLLTGTVAAPEDAAEAERLVKAFVGDATNVITRLKTATPLQVNLQVKFAEVSRSLVRSLGANLTSIDGSSGFQFGVGQGRPGFAPTFHPGTATGVGNSVKVYTPDPNNPGKFLLTDGTAVSPINPGTTLTAAGKFLGLDLLGALDLAETEGLVTTLSQPNLTALSGETADFLAGGEFPIPQSQGLGTTSVEYKKFGVSLSYTPTVLSNGRISLRVRPEVSELSSQGAVEINGFQIPALTVRRAETTIELGSGQSFMIAGLLSNNAQSTIQKAPGVGDLPILGNLFKSTSFQKGQTELVIVVTPFLVKPVDANDIKLPTDGFRAPTAFQQVLGNMENDGVSGGDRPKPGVAGETAAPPKIGFEDQASDPAQAVADDKKHSKQSKQAQADPIATPWLQPQVRKVSTMFKHATGPAAAALALTLGLTLAGCAGEPTNRSLDSIKQPVVARTNMTLDLNSGGGGLAITEEKRLNDWFAAMDLGYGDRVSIDDPIASKATKENVAEIAGRYGVLVSDGAPVTQGFIAPGTVRVVVTHSDASVPGCPDWRGHGNYNYNNGTNAGFGCAVNGNIAAMVANPEHLIHGAQGTGETVIMTSDKAIDSYRKQAPTGEKGISSTSSTSAGGS